MHSVYAGGRQTHTETVSLPFDPTNGFHEYRFDYAPDSLRFYADGVLMREWNDGLPQTPMRIYANAWFPTWLEGRKPKKNKYVLVDSIEHTQLP
jgi:beta-glucanase (GH16 family)